jgi:hypothetical protein
MFSALTMAQVSFQLGEEIGGEGKNSQTYKAHDPQLGADVVVKKIAKADLANQTDFFCRVSRTLCECTSKRRAGPLCMRGSRPCVRGDAIL